MALTSGKVLFAAGLVGLPGAAFAQETNWATWVLPAEYPYNTVGDGYSGYFAPGTTGEALDPQTGDTVQMVVSGEIYNYPTNPGFVWNPWGTEAYISPVSPDSPVGGDMLAATGYVAPEDSEYLSHTLNFSTDVTNAVMAIWSLGSPINMGQMTFSQPFTILSDNGDTLLTAGGDGDTGYTLDGWEGQGVLQFLGTYDTISWTVTDPETYMGFNIGLTTLDNPQAGEVVAVYSFDPATLPPVYATLEPAAEPVPPQSVLERVLASIDGSTNMARVNGVYANIAENVFIADSIGIDGSITTVLEGISEASATADGVAEGVTSVVLATTVTVGDMSTTVLGAVNTGEITLGVNQTVDEALAGSAAAYALSVGQIGGEAAAAAVVLNVAANMTDVNGSIRTDLARVNGTVGDLATTTLGAVNTGAITSGVNTAIHGIVGMGGTEG